MSGGFADILESIGKKDRGKLESKIPAWADVEIEVPSSLNFQQCSGQSAALYKASLISENCRVADLTGGLGVDSWAFALRAAALWYNERDEALRFAVERNFARLGIGNVVFNGFDIDAASAGWQEELRTFRPDVVYLDPARRSDSGRKVFLLEECSPDVLTLMPLLLEIAPRVIIKVSPMADLTMLRRRLGSKLEELHVVGSGGECKEVLCLCARSAGFRGIVLFEDGCTFNSSWGSAPGACSNNNVDAEAGTSGELLFVPSAAMTKSGLGPGICLMGYSEELQHFGKYWQVVENLPFASSVIKTLRRRYPQADVSSKGLPVSAEELRKKLGVKPGGPVQIIACNLSGDRRLMVCEPLNSAD